MSFYTKKDGKVLSVLEVEKFYAFYHQTELAKKIVKLDGEYYCLTDEGFKHVAPDDLVIYDKNKGYWSKDNEVVRKEKLDGGFAISEVPYICPFLMGFRFYMRFDQMIAVFMTMLEEFNVDDSGDADGLKSQLNWIIDNQDAFEYVLN